MTKEEKDKNPYLLYLGRIIENKGVGLAIDAARAVNMKIFVAGQGKVSDFYEGDTSHVEEIGFLNIEERKKWLAGAQIVYLCSLYSKPQIN